MRNEDMANACKRACEFKFQGPVQSLEIVNQPQPLEIYERGTESKQRYSEWFENLRIMFKDTYLVIKQMKKFTVR